MSKSVNRVRTAALAAGLSVTIERMAESTRTAQDAATACGCEVAQIVKSLIFEGADSGELKLILVSGRHELDTTAIRQVIGESLKRADARRVREETGFAIGGVAPIGHLQQIETWIDDALLNFGTVWVAAGAPNAVFQIKPNELIVATGGTVFRNGGCPGK